MARRVDPTQVAELRALMPGDPARAPRIPPGTRRDIGRAAWIFAHGAGRVTGAGPLNVFTTLARNRRLFRAWLRFAGRLMPRGKLPRADTELVILRVAVNCACPYEWHQHVVIGLRTGLTAEQIARIPQGSAAPGWSARQAALLDATDELHRQSTIGDASWQVLARELDEIELIELCMLAGHYAMLAGALNSLAVQIER